MELRSFALVIWVLIGMCYCDGGGGSLQQQQQQLQTDTTSYLTTSPSSLLPSVVSTSPSAPALIRPSSPSAKPHLKVLSFTYSTKLPPSDEGDGQVDRVTRKVDVVSSSEEEEEEEEEDGTDDFVEEVSFEDLGSSREEREELLREIQKQLDLLEERTRGEEEEKSATTPAWKYGFVPTARPEEVATLGPKPKPASKKMPRKKKSSKSRKKSPRVIQVSSHGEDRKRGNSNNLYSPTALPSYGFTATPRPLSHSPGPTPGPLQHFSPTPTPSYDGSSAILNIGQGSAKAPKKRHSDKPALRKNKSKKKKKASSSSAVKKNLNKKIYRYTIAPKLSEEQRAALIRSTTVSPVLLWSSSQEEEDDSSEEEATTVSAPISEEEEEDQSSVVTTTQYTPVYQGPWANFRRNPTPAPLPPAPTTVHSVDGEEEGEQEEEPLVFSDLSSSSSSSEDSWEEPESSSEEEEVEEPETSGSSGSRATLDLKAIPPLPAIRFLRPTTPSPAARPSTKALLLAALAEAEAKEAAAALRQTRRTKRKKSYVVRKPRPSSSSSSSLLNIVTKGDGSERPARPGKYKIIPIVRHVAEISQERDRKYAYEYITGNGMTRREEGYLRDPDGEAPVQVQKGSYSYTGTDGKVYTIEYVADENGFRPTGPHIPSNLLVPPPSSAAGGYGQR